ncbi:MAG: hypothetical protein HY235_07980 [Acidobacteria bacterium]|nr:hypothetical protein [Acidobacteriota bacterium]
MRLAVLCLCSPLLDAAGLELQIQYSAIQKVLTQQMFAHDGRFYVRGAPGAKCNYAYLENPVVDGAGGRIRIQAGFSGRNAANFFGLCLGLQDRFDLSILAAPYFENGLIRLRDVLVETGGRESLYAHRVRGAISENLSRRFEYKVADEAKRILERKRDGEPYTQQLTSFQVSQIRVLPEALVLNLEVTLVVK